MKLLPFFRMGALQTIKNYPALLGLSIFLLICLTIFAHLWKVAPSKAEGLDPKILLWFIALNEWVLIAIPNLHLQIEQDVRKGHLANLLLRPVSYLGTKFAEAAGIFLIQFLVLGLVSFGFSAFMSGVIPFGLEELGVFFFLGLLAGLLGIAFLMVIGVASFWILGIEPMYWIWEKFLFILGGLFLPPVFFPHWLQKIARCTPFPLILGARSALVFGFERSEVIWMLSSFLLWGLIIYFLLQLLYRKGLQILNIEGG